MLRLRFYENGFSSVQASRQVHELLSMTNARLCKILTDTPCSGALDLFLAIVQRAEAFTSVRDERTELHQSPGCREWYTSGGLFDPVTAPIGFHGII